MTAELTKQELHKLVRAAEVILQNARKPKLETVTEDEVLQLFNIKRKTLQNWISNGTITPDMYTIGVNGKRFYIKEKLINTKTNG